MRPVGRVNHGIARCGEAQGCSSEVQSQTLGGSEEGSAAQIQRARLERHRPVSKVRPKREPSSDMSDALAFHSAPAIAPAAALNAVRRIADRWHVSRRDLPVLLGCKSQTVRTWYKTAPETLDKDVVDRIAHLIGIYDALHTIFSDSDYADRWIYESNRAFRGRKPFDLIASGDIIALIEVHRYLLEAFTKPRDRSE